MSTNLGDKKGNDGVVAAGGPGAGPVVRYALIGGMTGGFLGALLAALLCCLMKWGCSP